MPEAGGARDSRGRKVRTGGALARTKSARALSPVAQDGLVLAGIASTTAGRTTCLLFLVDNHQVSSRQQAAQPNFMGVFWVSQVGTYDQNIPVSNLPLVYDLALLLVQESWAKRGASLKDRLPIIGIRREPGAWCERTFTSQLTKANSVLQLPFTIIFSDGGGQFSSGALQRPIHASD